MTKRAKKKKAVRAVPPRGRIPLPKKIEKSHGDAKKFHRPREKQRLRRELDEGDSRPPT